MSNLRRITTRERHLILLYSNWEFSITPAQFYAKWGVSYELIALICSRSDSTVRGWFRNGSNRRYPTHNDLLHLALMDFFLEHFEEIPEQVLHWLNFDNKQPDLK
ncbi:hypothetical protein [Nostoc sp. UHCC 0870]|uniref:hypothetical protein n=1 Tax=Nostoc sp. UHCC 0870 TaxID=2914041 RepID=UPI001EDE838F|nr:hypothetical protein [Nostoc sp. UHCC 0870]UKP00938.1 hypothetical protein L6494_27650 [Nostoc sp. UHCC 0870]